MNADEQDVYFKRLMDKMDSDSPNVDMPDWVETAEQFCDWIRNRNCKNNKQGEHMTNIYSEIESIMTTLAKSYGRELPLNGAAYTSYVKIKVGTPRQLIVSMLERYMLGLASCNAFSDIQFEKDLSPSGRDPKLTFCLKLAPLQENEDNDNYFVNFYVYTANVCPKYTVQTLIVGERINLVETKDILSREPVNVYGYIVSSKFNYEPTYHQWLATSNMGFPSYLESKGLVVKVKTATNLWFTKDGDVA